VTRADIALHRAHLDDIARAVGPAAHLIEFGSGAGIKIRMLLEACVDVRAYTPIEISREALDASVVQLTAEFPDLDLRPVQADYTRPLPDDLKQLDPPARRRVVYFPGSTISNFDHASARDFLGRMAAIAGPDGAALVGSTWSRTSPA
jgi:L-histidine N-alpha-methyltransferase